MAALTNSSIWHSLTLCITLINDLVLINAYTGVYQRLQNLLMLLIRSLSTIRESSVRFSQKKSVSKKHTRTAGHTEAFNADTSIYDHIRH